MERQADNIPLPRDKDTLLRELDLRLRLGDIRRAHNLKQSLAPKWWEAGFILILFTSALGLLSSLYHWSRINGEGQGSWLFFWFSMTVVSVLMSFEFLLMKIFHLRRSNDIHIRMLEDLRERLDRYEQELAEMHAQMGVAKIDDPDIQ